MSNVVIVGGGAAGMAQPLPLQESDMKSTYMRKMKNWGKRSTLPERAVVM